MEAEAAAQQQEMAMREELAAQGIDPEEAIREERKKQQDLDKMVEEQ